jgi:hypothetical protein
MKITSTEIAYAEELANCVVNDPELKEELDDAVGAAGYRLYDSHFDAEASKYWHLFREPLNIEVRKCVLSDKEKWAKKITEKVYLCALKRLGEIYAEEIAESAEETKKFWEAEAKKWESVW